MRRKRIAVWTALALLVGAQVTPTDNPLHTCRRLYGRGWKLEGGCRPGNPHAISIESTDGTARNDYVLVGGKADDHIKERHG